MARVRFEGVHKTYPNGFQAVKGLDLAIDDGELMVLVGPSGCGKSTALRMIAGLETPTQGRIWIGDRDVTDVRVQDRDVAMVFQNYALYPHRTVRQNLAFALELRKTERAEIDQRVTNVSSSLGLDALLDRKPAQLSGGQRQRVALGRAIVREPQAFLFDEPLSNLDAKLRVDTRAELSRLHRRLGATMIYVTHDQEEAMTLGDRIAVLHEGRIQQCAPPLEVYRRPANVFVAGFVGSPAMNLLEGTLERDGDAPAIALTSFSHPHNPRALIQLSDSSHLERGHPGAQSKNHPILLGIRPEDVEVVSAREGDMVSRVDVMERLGADVLLHVERDVRVLADADAPIVENQEIGLRFRRERLHLFDAESGERLN